MTKARDLANASTALSAVSATELGYLDGVTSAVQTQLDNKVDETGGSVISANSSGNALEIRQTGAGNALVIEDSTNPDSSPVVINADGQLVVGSTIDTNYGGGVGKVVAASTGSTWIKNTRFSADAGGPTIGLGKSRNASVDGQTIVQSGDAVGAIGFYGSDGTQFLQAANITGQIDGTPGTNDMPGRLTFATTADGSTAGTERMRIDSAGNVGIGTTSPTAKLDVNGSFNATNYFVAGKNKIINGDFGIWQRGTSFSVNNASVYTADRWYIGGSNAVTISQQAFTAGTAPVAGYEGTYFCRFNRTSRPTIYDDYFLQRIEDVRTFAGQTVTLSFWAKTNSGTTTLSGAYIEQWFGSGGSTNVYVNSSGPLTLTTSWQRFTTTMTMPSIAGKTIGAGSFVAVNFAMANAVGTSAVYDIWGVQLEAGSVATPFTTATGTIQGELAACQRYFERFDAGAAYGFYIGYQQNSTLQRMTASIAPKRTTPTITVGGSGGLRVLNAGGGELTVTGISTITYPPNSNTITFNTSVASGGTAGDACTFYASSSGNVTIDYGAEL